MSFEQRIDWGSKHCRNVKRLPEWLSANEMKKILDAPDIHTPEGVRNKAVLELLYSSGLRVSEALNLKLSDFNSSRDEARVLGKGNKHRYVPVSKTASKWLGTYIEKTRPMWANELSDETVFISATGRKLERFTIANALKDYAKKVGINKRVFPHIIRHSVATHLLENGMNLRYIQEFLGHEFISTTQIYAHMDAKRLVEVHRKFHPRG